MDKMADYCLWSYPWFSDWHRKGMPFSRHKISELATCRRTCKLSMLSQCFHNAFTTVSPFFNGSVGLGLRFAFWLIGSVVQLRRNESKSWFKDMGLVHNCVKILEVNLISLASTDLVQVHTSVDFCFYGLWATWPCLLSVVFSCECCKPLCIAKLAVACSPRSKMHGIFCFRRLRRAALPKLPARSSEDPRCAGLSSVVSK